MGMSRRKKGGGRVKVADLAKGTKKAGDSQSGKVKSDMKKAGMRDCKSPK